jgi:protein SCO1/2
MTETTPPAPSNQRWLWIGGGVGVFALAVGLYFLFSFLFPPASDADYLQTMTSIIDEDNNGVAAITPPRLVADFTLESHTGDPFTLSDMDGKPILLYFGYTHCPDVCPLTMMEIKRVHQLLGDRADDVGYIFASVDGERDTAEWLARYLEFRGMDEFMIALTGSEGDLRRIGADYGLFFEKQRNTGSEASYIVDHTASTFLINQDRELTAILAFGTAPDVIAAEIEILLDAAT